MKKYLKIKKNGVDICEKCEYANTAFSRFMGLMFRKSIPKTNGLLLEPCNQIHTFNMRFSIDVIFMDSKNTVLDIFKDVKPWRVRPFVKNAKKCLELNSGMADNFSLSAGDILDINVIK